MDDTLLVIEDQPDLGAILCAYFRGKGWDVALYTNLAAAKAALASGEMQPLVVLADMNLPDGCALDLLEEMSGKCPNSEWVFLTGYATVADSVRALQLGAYDFLEKPCAESRLDLVIAGAARSARAQRRLREYQTLNHQQYAIGAFVGKSAAAVEVRSVLGKLTQVPMRAMIVAGETGTGKGLVARILHHNGARASGLLVELNCAALPRELLESELFGHEAGAFTGANRRRRGLLQQADKGTLFLDEIAEMDFELQSKLLKVIEDQRVRPLGTNKEVPIDVQIIAASNRDLKEGVAAKSFRADLYHRLSVFKLHLPPLRERLSDMRELVPRFLAEFNARSGKAVRDIPDPVWSILEAYDWPGNVRELRNVIERCVLLSDGPDLPLRWLQLDAGNPRTAVPQAGGDHVIVLPLDGSMSLDDMDRTIIKAALKQAGYNVSAAARNLGTTRQTLRYRARKYGFTES